MKWLLARLVLLVLLWAASAVVSSAALDLPGSSRWMLVQYQLAGSLAAACCTATGRRALLTAGSLLRCQLPPSVLLSAAALLVQLAAEGVAGFLHWQTPPLTALLAAAMLYSRQRLTYSRPLYSALLWLTAAAAGIAPLRWLAQAGALRLWVAAAASQAASVAIMMCALLAVAGSEVAARRLQRRQLRLQRAEAKAAAASARLSRLRSTSPSLPRSGMAAFDASVPLHTSAMSMETRSSESDGDHGLAEESMHIIIPDDMAVAASAVPPSPLSRRSNRHQALPTTKHAVFPLSSSATTIDEGKRSSSRALPSPPHAVSVARTMHDPRRMHRYARSPLDWGAAAISPRTAVSATSRASPSASAALMAAAASACTPAAPTTSAVDVWWLSTLLLALLASAVASLLSSRLPTLDSLELHRWMLCAALLRGAALQLAVRALDGLPLLSWAVLMAAAHSMLHVVMQPSRLLSPLSLLALAGQALMSRRYFQLKRIDFLGDFTTRRRRRGSGSMTGDDMDSSDSDADDSVPILFAFSLTPSATESSDDDDGDDGDGGDEDIGGSVAAVAAAAGDERRDDDDDDDDDLDRHAAVRLAVEDGKQEGDSSSSDGKRDSGIDSRSSAPIVAGGGSDSTGEAALSAAAASADAAPPASALRASVSVSSAQPRSRLVGIQRSLSMSSIAAIAAGSAVASAAAAAAVMAASVTSPRRSRHHRSSSSGGGGSSRGFATGGGAAASAATAGGAIATAVSGIDSLADSKAAAAASSTASSSGSSSGGGSSSSSSSSSNSSSSSSSSKRMWRHRRSRRPSLPVQLEALQPCFGCAAAVVLLTAALLSVAVLPRLPAGRPSALRLGSNWHASWLRVSQFMHLRAQLNGVLLPTDSVPHAWQPPATSTLLAQRLAALDGSSIVLAPGMPSWQPPLQRQQQLLIALAQAGAAVVVCLPQLSAAQPAELVAAPQHSRVLLLSPCALAIPALQQRAVLLLATSSQHALWAELLPSAVLWLDVNSAATAANLRAGTGMADHALAAALLVTSSSSAIRLQLPHDYALLPLLPRSSLRSWSAASAANRTAAAASAAVSQTLLPALARLPGGWRLWANAQRKNSGSFYTVRFMNMAANSFFSGGAERYALDLAELCAEHNMSVSIYQWGSSSWMRRLHGVNIISLARGSQAAPAGFLDWRAEWRLRSPFVRSMQSIAQGWHALTFYSAFYDATPTVAEPSIGISHGVAWDHPEREFSSDGSAFWQQSKLYTQASALLARLVSVDSNTVNWLQTVSYKQARKWSVVPNYADSSVFFPRDAFDQPRAVTRILFPRRLVAARGVQLVLACVPRWLSTFGRSVEVHFVGHARTDIAASVLRLARAWPGQVRMYKRQPSEMAEEYRQADISLIPTLYSEGTSLSALEAMASGNAVVASRVGGLTDLIIHNYNGLLVERTAPALCAAVADLLRSPKRLSRLQRNAVRVAAAFDKPVWKAAWWKIIAPQLRNGSYHAHTPVKPSPFIALHLSRAAVQPPLQARLGELVVALLRRHALLYIYSPLTLAQLAAAGLHSFERLQWIGSDAPPLLDQPSEVIAEEGLLSLSANSGLPLQLRGMDVTHVVRSTDWLLQPARAWQQART